jgi:hypothetical protein
VAHTFSCWKIIYQNSTALHGKSLG